MRRIFSIPIIVLLYLFSQNAFAQTPGQLNSGVSSSKNKQLKANKSKGKPLVKQEKGPRKKLFGNKKSEKVPPGYAFDNRETGPKKLTDNPNAKQMLPKDQHKRLVKMRKKKNKSSNGLAK